MPSSDKKPSEWTKKDLEERLTAKVTSDAAKKKELEERIRRVRERDQGS
jgi:hypothetical protein